MSLRKYTILLGLTLGFVSEYAVGAFFDEEQREILVGQLRERMSVLEGANKAITFAKERDELGAAHPFELVVIEHKVDGLEKKAECARREKERLEELNWLESYPRRFLVTQLIDKNNYLENAMKQKGRASFFGRSPWEARRLSAVEIHRMDPNQLAILECDLRRQEQEIKLYPWGEPLLHDLRQSFRKMRGCFW
jgi:hypothetical protein